MKPQRLTPQQLADLPETWENPTVDTSKYIQAVGRAWEVDEDTFRECLHDGTLCQQVGNRYFIA